MVDLALSSMALAIFARAQHHAPAATEASKKYCSALKVAQARIAQLASSALDERDIDSCLLAGSLMSRYEVAAHRPGVYDSSIQSCSHYDGAMAILKVWNDKLRDMTPTFIIKQTRRALIKAAVIRYRKLPDWLLDGTRFCEQGDEFDRVVARLWKLQYAFKSIQKRCPMIGEVIALHNEAQKLDKALRGWTAHVPSTCSAHRHVITDPNVHALPQSHLYSSAVYSYPKHGNAAAWCRYFAVRMLINSIRLGLLELSREILISRSYEQQRLECITQMQAMADSIAASIPFCLERIKIDSSLSNSQPSITISTNQDIKPHAASLLVWPLTIASSMEGIDHKQQLWFRSELATFGKIIGDGILECSETHRLTIIWRGNSGCWELAPTRINAI
jgi:hypothetical protein